MKRIFLFIREPGPSHPVLFLSPSTPVSKPESPSSIPTSVLLPALPAQSNDMTRSSQCIFSPASTVFLPVSAPPEKHEFCAFITLLRVLGWTSYRSSDFFLSACCLFSDPPHVTFAFQASSLSTPPFFFTPLQGCALVQDFFAAPFLAVCATDSSLRQTTPSSGRAYCSAFLSRGATLISWDSDHALGPSGDAELRIPKLPFFSFRNPLFIVPLGFLRPVLLNLLRFSSALLYLPSRLFHR